ncbi:site-specific recombinase XerD [Coprobacillus sp. CAG:698]|nr:site-specific recombinase XerD [Coprobacillus sp. CAG:698]
MNKTINEIATEWKNEKKRYVKESTMAVYKLIVDNHIVKAFGEKKISLIKNVDIQTFINEKLDSGLSEKTCRDILVVFKMIFKFSVKQNYCKVIMFDIIFPTRKKNTSIEVFTQIEENRIIKYIDSNFTFQNLGILICLYTGVRIGEICALKWEDIDIEKKLIKISKTLQRIYTKDEKTRIIIDSPKTINSNREIPLADIIYKIIKPLYKIINKEYYVITNSLKYTEPRTYRNYYFELLDKLKLRKLKFHCLRHTFATRCIEANVDYKTLSVILGHSNISTTLNLYVHPNYDQKKRCIDKMSKLLK